EMINKLSIHEIGSIFETCTEDSWINKRFKKRGSGDVSFLSLGLNICSMNEDLYDFCEHVFLYIDKEDAFHLIRQVIENTFELKLEEMEDDIEEPEFDPTPIEKKRKASSQSVSDSPKRQKCVRYNFNLFIILLEHAKHPNAILKRLFQFFNHL